MLSKSPVGHQFDLFGPPASHASPSRSPAKAAGQTTSATSGPSSATSSPSAALQRSLESRLQAALAGRGSPEYVLTWKHWDMPWGPPICALRAKARRTFDRDCIGALSGWRTPTTGSPNSLRGQGQDPIKRMEQGHAVNLTDQVRLAGWTTPQAHDVTPRGQGQKARHGTRHGCADLNADAALAGWPTATVGNALGSQAARGASPTGKRPDGSKATVSLNQVAKLARWPTATAQDHSRGTRPPRPHDTGIPLTQAIGAALIGSNASTASGAAYRLNPGFSLWLMGFPIEWALCAAQVTPLSRRSRPSS